MPVGIDIVKIERIVLTDKFLNRVLSEDELAIYAKKPNKKEFVAGRFAAKEAFLKANSVGLGAIPLKEINVVYAPSGAPIIKYNGNVYSDVSISHEKEYAIAIVII